MGVFTWKNSLMTVNIPGGYTSVNVLRVKLGNQQNLGPISIHVSGKTNSGTFCVSDFVHCLACILSLPWSCAQVFSKLLDFCPCGPICPLNLFPCSGTRQSG